jgi:hypothetical protein
MITGLVGVWILPENETMRTRSIRVSSINPKYRSQNGALYNKKMTTLICYPMSKKGSTFVVPDTVRKTAPLSFRGNYYLEKVVLPKNLRKLGRGSFLKSAISEWRCDGGVKKYEKSAFNYIDAADGYAIDMNTLTKLYQELLVPMGTEVTFKSEMQKWIGMFWQKGQTVTKSREDVKPKGITDACTEYDIVYHTGEFMTNKYSMVWKKMKLYVDESDTIRGRVIELMVDNVDYSVTIVRNNTKKEYREDISLKAADSSVTYTFKLSLTKDEKYPTLKIDVLAGKDRLFLAELSQKAVAKDQKQSLQKLRTTGEKTMEAAQKDRDKINGKDGMEKYFWLYGNKKNTDGMTLTHYLYGVDIPAFLNKIKENCGVDLTQLAQKFDYY